MKRKWILLLLLMGGMAYAKPVVALDSTKHEVRVGWGDYLFESLVYHPNSNGTNYRYTGHVFGEYQYRINDWFGVGAQVDYSQVFWDNASTNEAQTYFNVAILPAARFTYFYHPWVTIYSALYLGLNINSGNTSIYTGQTTTTALAFGATLLGIQVGQKGWFGGVEIGGLSSINNMHEIYLMDSRIFTISLGYHF